MKGANHTLQLGKGQAKWKGDLREENLNIAIPKELVNFWYKQKWKFLNANFNYTPKSYLFR